MGKYLDIAKRVEARFKAEGRWLGQRLATPPTRLAAEQEAPPDYRALSEEMTRQMSEDMPFVYGWLRDHHPVLWQQIRALDGELLRLEQAGVPEAIYRAKLADLLTLCREAKALKEGRWGALLVKSSLLGCEVWVVRDEAALSLVKDDPQPTFFADEIELLKDKSPEQLQDILKAKAVFPGCRVVQ